MWPKCWLVNLLVLKLLISFCLCDIKLLEGVNKRSVESVQRWPQYNNFGQPSAVDVDKNGNVYVFHRGDRQWNYYTFRSNIFVDREKGPIVEDTIVVLEPLTGSLLKKTGRNFFYLPHGLTIDHESNVWLTDVAMHQVFKFPPVNLSKNDSGWKPILTLGTLLEPGNDNKHFCKPTSVAVDRVSNEFYVSDGYCNGRIVKYDSSGKILLQWGRMVNGFSEEMSGYMFSVPHALAFAQEKQILYVADREHFRVLSFYAASGKFERSFVEEQKSRVFSVDYSPKNGGLLFALLNNDTSSQAVFIYNANTGKFLLNLSQNIRFTNPHDLALSPEGDYCYVVELKPFKIWKIKIDVPQIFHSSTERYEHSEQKERVEEPIPAESKIDKNDNLEASSSFLAVTLVISLVIISFLIFMFHYYKKKGYRRHETRRLILDDDEGGIQLT